MKIQFENVEELMKLLPYSKESFCILPVFEIKNEDGYYIGCKSKVNIQTKYQQFIIKICCFSHIYEFFNPEINKDKKGEGFTHAFIPDPLFYCVEEKNDTYFIHSVFKKLKKNNPIKLENITFTGAKINFLFQR